MIQLSLSQSKSSLKSVKVTKYDNVTLELAVDFYNESPWLNPEFELLGLKADGLAVRQKIIL